MPPILTAVLAVRDEEEMLGGCLRSLRFCDEIVVVVDDRTTDRSEQIALELADVVLVEPFEDFSQIRNVGIARAKGDWILHVDADERITPELAREIRAALARDEPMWAYRAPTINHFWGRRMEHGGWAEMQQVRLVRRDHATYKGRVHEDTDIPAARTGQLRGERWHLTHRSLEENLVKTVRYARLEAANLFEAGAPRVTPLTFAKAMALEFGRRMVRRTAWRDGMPGVIEAIFQPFVRFCTMAMLWELQQGDDVRRRYEALESEMSRRLASSRSEALKATSPGSSG